METPSTETAADSSGLAGTAAAGVPPSTVGIPATTTAPSGDPMMGELLRTMQTLVAALGPREAVPPVPVRAPVQSEASSAHALRDFLRLGPPAFYGEPDPTRAEQWLRQITRDLDTSGVTDGRTRITFARPSAQG